MALRDRYRYHRTWSGGTPVADETRTDVDSGDSGDNANGHTHRVPEWGDVEFVPLPPRRRTAWSWLMSTRPVRNIAEYAQAERRPVPAWVPSTIVLLGLSLITNFGLFIYWKGDTDRFIRDNATTHDDLIRQKAKVEQLEKDYEALQQNVGVWILYESKIRELMVSHGRVEPSDLPPMPAWPERHGKTPTN